MVLPKWLSNIVEDWKEKHRLVVNAEQQNNNNNKKSGLVTATPNPPTPETSSSQLEEDYVDRLTDELIREEKERFRKRFYRVERDEDIDQDENDPITLELKERLGERVSIPGRVTKFSEVLNVLADVALPLIPDNDNDWQMWKLKIFEENPEYDLPWVYIAPDPEDLVSVYKEYKRKQQRIERNDGLTIDEEDDFPYPREMRLLFETLRKNDETWEAVKSRYDEADEFAEKLVQEYEARIQSGELTREAAVREAFRKFNEGYSSKITPGYLDGINVEYLGPDPNGNNDFYYDVEDDQNIILYDALVAALLGPCREQSRQMLQLQALLNYELPGSDDLDEYQELIETSLSFCAMDFAYGILERWGSAQAEATDDQGRNMLVPYYYDVETMESQWERPEEINEIIEYAKNNPDIETAEHRCEMPFVPFAACALARAVTNPNPTSLPEDEQEGPGYAIHEDNLDVSFAEYDLFSEMGEDADDPYMFYFDEDLHEESWQEEHYDHLDEEHERPDQDPLLTALIEEETASDERFYGKSSPLTSEQKEELYKTQLLEMDVNKRKAMKRILADQELEVAENFCEMQHAKFLHCLSVLVDPDELIKGLPGVEDKKEIQEDIDMQRQQMIDEIILDNFNARAMDKLADEYSFMTEDVRQQIEEDMLREEFPAYPDIDLDYPIMGDALEAITGPPIDVATFAAGLNLDEMKELEEDYNDDIRTWNLHTLLNDETGAVPLRNGLTAYPEQDFKIRYPSGWTQYPDGRWLLPRSNAILYPNGLIPLPSGIVQYPPFTIQLADGRIRLPDGTIEHPALPEESTTLLLDLPPELRRQHYGKLLKGTPDMALTEEEEAEYKEFMEAEKARRMKDKIARKLLMQEYPGITVTNELKKKLKADLAPPAPLKPAETAAATAVAATAAAAQKGGMFTTFWNWLRRKNDEIQQRSQQQQEEEEEEEEEEIDVVHEIIDYDEIKEIRRRLANKEYPTTKVVFDKNGNYLRTIVINNTDPAVKGKPIVIHTRSEIIEDEKKEGDEKIVEEGTGEEDSAAAAAAATAAATATSKTAAIGDDDDDDDDQ